METDHQVTSLKPMAITLGEPAGIGSEVTLKARLALGSAAPNTLTPFFLMDDPFRVERIVRHFGLDLKVISISNIADCETAFSEGLPVYGKNLGKDALQNITPGKPSVETANVVIQSIEQAIKWALDGKVSAVITNPIQKEILMTAGFKHPGHTEFVGELCKDIPLPHNIPSGPVMMLTSPTLRVAPVTIHQPLRTVPDTLSSEQIFNTIHSVFHSLRRDFALQNPRIVVCGLNPHAGENGQLGSEDKEVILPVVQQLQKQGMQIAGPLPADTLFHEEARQHYDAVITMYHDQGLIPIKTIAFHEAVNTTIGLPVVRTSPDHGTAIAIADKFVARPDSMIQAILTAQVIAFNRQNFDAMVAK